MAHESAGGGALSSLVLGAEAPASVTDAQPLRAAACETEIRDDGRDKIDVRTDAGVVVLSGDVPNITSSARASELARGVHGVRSVKNDLTVARSSRLQ